ncbi:MAG: response regulator [Elusimicrobia bacterium]|nr:response regulator [Elusimicrobiota bacterium]MBI5882153.1 response regulator [Elusimicrobiota bacterium]
MIAQILIADDNTDINELISDFLTARNHKVIVVTDGFALAQKAAEHKPHLIITDIQMPGAYGSAAYKVLQNDPKTASIPIIFISAHPYEKLKPLLPVDPKTRFVQKPISLDALEVIIKELLPLGGYVP